ncbi:MAG TPA: hypothetical protein VFG44_10800 [Burkholderiales bacterium]|nr:hypothetical protein [Burkholderiales bacterium]
MPFEDRIENLYLKVWKAVVLCVATIALIAAIGASAAAINGLFVEAPPPPPQVKPEDRGDALRQAVSIDKFQQADPRAPGAAARDNPGPKSGAGIAISESLRKISNNLDDYIKGAFPPTSPIPEATEWSVRHVMKDVKLRNDAQLRLYLSSLEALSAELAKAGSAQATLPEERRMDPYRLLRWHAETVQRAFQAVDQENAKLQKSYQQKLIDYENRHTRIMSYIGLAAGAVAIFVFTIFLFVIIRIERDLRAMAVASMATTKQLEG